jgi:hypothetical protein
VLLGPGVRAFGCEPTLPLLQLADQVAALALELVEAVLGFPDR